MASKMVTDRQKSAAKVAQAALVHAQEAAEGLTPLLTAELLDGEQLPDVAQLQRLLARALQRRAARMVETDETHLREVVVATRLRRRRAEAAALLRERLTAARLAVDGIFGSGQRSELFGAEPEMPTDPVVLLRIADRLVGRFQQGAAAADEGVRLDGFTVDIPRLVAQIEEPVAALRGVIEEIDAQQRLSESTLLAKKAEIEAYNALFLQVARLLESIFAAADLTSLAAKVRPSRRRPGRTAEEEGETAEAEAPPPIVPPEVGPPLPVAN